MGNIKKDNKSFSEELKRKIYFFIIELVNFVESLSRHDNLCRIAIDQLLRCGTSIGANYMLKQSPGVQEKTLQTF